MEFSKQKFFNFFIQYINIQHTAHKWLIPTNITMDLQTWDFRIILSLCSIKDVRLIVVIIIG
jgi:hypothetical protein